MSASSAEKRARAKSTKTQEPPIAWSDVLRVIQEEPTRSRALARFRAAEYKADEFATRRNVRVCILEGLVDAEDSLELTRGDGATANRRAIKAVRRRLEVELWP